MKPAMTFPGMHSTTDVSLKLLQATLKKRAAVIATHPVTAADLDRWAAELDLIAKGPKAPRTDYPRPRGAR